MNQQYEDVEKKIAMLKEIIKWADENEFYSFAVKTARNLEKLRQRESGQQRYG